MNKVEYILLQLLQLLQGPSRSWKKKEAKEA